MNSRRLRSLLLCSVAYAATTGAPTLAAGFDWNTWAAIANEHPCEWLDAATTEKIIGERATAARSLTAAASTCRWTSADGRLLLSASVSNFDSAANMVGERAGQLRDVATGRFERLPTSGVTTAVLRKDRLQLTIFPNSDSETAVLRVQGHPVLREDTERRNARDRRLRDFAAAIIRKHGL